MMYCTITTISASPILPGKSWVGTDDGRIHMTDDGGDSWKEFTKKISLLGGKKEYWVSRILSSRHHANTAFVCKTGFRNDDFRPLVFITEDNGKTWQKITNGLPDAPVNVIIEDHKDENLLYLGNDQGVYISFDRGNNWQSFEQNMPSVPVKDLKIHAEENDLVAGTYGRGAYVIDVSLVQQFNTTDLSKDYYLFEIEPKPVRNYSQRAYWGNYEMTGDNHLFTPNEPNGFVIYYAINNVDASKSNIEIVDGAGLAIDTLDIQVDKGFHKLIYDTRELNPGLYRVRLKVNGDMLEKSAILKPSPIWPVGHGAGE